MLRITLTILAIFVIINPADLTAEQRGLKPADYLKFQFVNDPQISPDGERIAIVRSKISDDQRSRHSTIWMVDTDNPENAYPFTSGESDRSPRWSPDGEYIAFLSDRGDGTKIYKISSHGGEAHPMMETEHDITSFEWSPEGDQLLLRLNKDLEDDDEENEEPEPDVKEVTTSLYKADGTGILPKRRAQIWTYSVEEDTLMQITDGTDWNDNSPVYSNDGSMIAFNANRTGDEYEGDYNQDIYTIPADSGAVEKLTETDARATSPVWSPDDDRIAFNYTEGRYQKSQIYLIDADGQNKRNASEQLDHIPSNLQWSDDGEGLYYQASHEGGTGLFYLDLETEEIEPVLEGRFSVGSVQMVDNGDQITFTRESETELAEVWQADQSGEQETRMTALNDALLDTLALNQLETFWFENRDGGQSQGFLLKPIGWEEGESYPLVLNIKGGPGGMWGHRWFHEIQMMAQRGYGVFFTNYRGSHGYGFDHQSSVFQDYGGADYEDNMDGLSYALENNDWIDDDRLFITGGSHGGFLTNWITAHHPDKFQAAVTQRSVSNWVSEAGTQAYTPQMMRDEFGGTIWENYDLYWGRSPLKYADQVEAPTLIIHSDRDEITPIGQGEEWYYALKINDVPVEMVVFEGESHGLSRSGTPINLIERLNRILDWFENYL